MFGDEDGEVAVLVVDAGAQGDEPEEEDSCAEAPHRHLPVAQLVQETTVVLQDLLVWHDVMGCGMLWWVVA